MNNVQTTSSQQELVTYLHQCFFLPPPSTIIISIKIDQLLGVPGLTTELVQKYLPPSTATTKGYMHRFPQNMKSARTHTIRNVIGSNNHNDMMPRHENNAQCEIYCFAALSDAHEKKIYTDLTGKFPVRSYQGNQYIFLAYVYDINTILVRPMKTRTEGDKKKVFQYIYTYIMNKNHKPKLHIMDN